MLRYALEGSYVLLDLVAKLVGDLATISPACMVLGGLYPYYLRHLTEDKRKHHRLSYDILKKSRKMQKVGSHN